MQKIGINKYRKTNKKYFTTLIKDKSISFDQQVEEINSIIINPVVMDLSLIKSRDKLSLTIKTDIKIIYLKKEDISLYVYKDFYIDSETLDIPKILEGNNINNLDILNKIKVNIFVENVNLKLRDSKLFVAYFLSLNIEIPPTYYIAYSINNGFGDDVFLSNMDGKNLIQKTFNINMDLKKLNWSLDGGRFYYLSNIGNEVKISFFEDMSSNINNTLDISKNIVDFSFINNNEIIINICDYNQYELYYFNLKRKFLKKVNTLENAIVNIKPYYSIKDKLLYFLSGDNDLKYLYSVDEVGNISTVFKYLNTIDYYINDFTEYIILKAINEMKINLVLLNKLSKDLSYLNIDIEYEDILDVKFLELNNGNKNILILIKNKAVNNEKNTLLLYNLDSRIAKGLIDGDIKKIEIDYTNPGVFWIIKRNNLNYVEKLNVSNIYLPKDKEIIFKTKAEIKDICIKKVYNEK